MDTKVSEVKKAIETSLKSQPEFLKGRKLIDLEQKKENLSDISENVEFYLDYRGNIVYTALTATHCGS